MGHENFKRVVQHTKYGHQCKQIIKMNDVGNLHERDGTDTSDVKQLRQVIDQSVENAETKNVYVMVEIVVSFQASFRIGR